MQHTTIHMFTYKPVFTTPYGMKQLCESIKSKLCARPAGPKITLRVPRLYIHIYMYVRPHLSRAQ